jgi:hypothetical protein
VFTDLADAGCLLSDELAVLKQPRSFRVLVQVYLYWHEISGEELIEVL